MRCSLRMVIFSYCGGRSPPRQRPKHAGRRATLLSGRTHFSSEGPCEKGDQETVATLLDDNSVVESDGKNKIPRRGRTQGLGSLASNNEGGWSMCGTVDFLVGSSASGMPQQRALCDIWVLHKGGDGRRSRSWISPFQRREPRIQRFRKRQAFQMRIANNPCRTLPINPENAATKGRHGCVVSSGRRGMASEPGRLGRACLIRPLKPLRQHWTCRSFSTLFISRQRQLYGEHGGDPGEPVISNAHV